MQPLTTWSVWSMFHGLVSWPCRPIVRTRVLNQTADCLLRTRSLLGAAAQQEEAERDFARKIKRLTYLKTRILYNMDTVATQGSCTRGRESTHPFLVMETE